jgi:hypothetical protein
MKKLNFLFFASVLNFTSCQNTSTDERQGPLNKTYTLKTLIKNSDLHLEHSIRSTLYVLDQQVCESDNYVSILEGIKDKTSNYAYKMTIISKKNGVKVTKIINPQPKQSTISYCTDSSAVVGFSCGGPCYNRTFIFIDKNKPNEQYLYQQEIKNNLDLIAHVREEDNYEKLIIHNFKNNKELVVDISEQSFYIYGRMDSIIYNNGHIFLHYYSKEKKKKTKKVNLKAIM